MAKNKLTLNILEDITRKINGTRNDDGNINLIVFNGSDIELKERIEELKEIKSRGFTFSLAFSFMADRIVDTDYIIGSLNPIEVYKEEDIFRLKEIVEKHYCIIGPNITVNTLSKVTLGMVDSFISTLVWSFLHKGKPVYLDFSAARKFLGEKSDNEKINGTIHNYISILKDMGVCELVPGKYLESILDKSNSKDIDIYYKKVITESDLKDLPKGERLILPKGTIITPLAKDKANLLGIQLEIEK